MTEKYLQELKINSIGERTIKNHRVILSTAIQFKEPLTDWKKDDVNNYISMLQKKMKPGSVETYKMVIKKYFAWAGKHDIVAHIKIKMPDSTLTRDDILTVEEINRAIESTNSHLYKAMIAFLFDSGGRISEIVKSIRVREITETDRGMIIPLHETKEKKRERRILCVFSAQYIRNYITYCGLKGEDYLFDRDESSIIRMFEKIKNDAGIEKPFRPHKLRHAQATDMVLRGYQESIIRKKLGWTADSAMIARYQHIVDDDVIDATAEKNGTHIERKPIENLKKAEELKLADASLQLSKLSDENTELKNDVAILKAEREEFKKGMELLNKFNKLLEDNKIKMDGMEIVKLGKVKK